MHCRRITHPRRSCLHEMSEATWQITTTGTARARRTCLWWTTSTRRFANRLWLPSRTTCRDSAANTRDVRPRCWTRRTRRPSCACSRAARSTLDTWAWRRSGRLRYGVRHTGNLCSSTPKVATRSCSAPCGMRPFTSTSRTRARWSAVPRGSTRGMRNCSRTRISTATAQSSSTATCKRRHTFRNSQPNWRRTSRPSLKWIMKTSTMATRRRLPQSTALRGR